MSISNIVDRLNFLDCSTVVNDGLIQMSVLEESIEIVIEQEWLTAIADFYKARQYSYCNDRRVLTSNRTAEFHVIRLDPGFYYQVRHVFSGVNNTAVCLGPASKQFLLSHFESQKYKDSFDIILSRLKSRIERAANRSRRYSIRTISFSDLMFNFHTIKYTAPRKPKGRDIDLVALEPIKACLFSLAYKKNQCWELSYEIKSKGLNFPVMDDRDDGDLEIPRASYDDAAVTFYKVAKSSQFPSQAFIAYYHILEFHFLRVADEALFNAVSAQLNNPDFRATYDNVSRLLAAIKRNDNTSSEKEMLLSVLRKYVPEEDFIDFVMRTESSVGEEIYTKFKQPIFGERIMLNLKKDHALSSVALIIKHIRNALVHSSDKYSREDCFLPLSESEDLIVRFIPLVRFLAERVIFATTKQGL